MNHLRHGSCGAESKQGEARARVCRAEANSRRRRKGHKLWAEEERKRWTHVHDTHASTVVPRIAHQETRRDHRREQAEEHRDRTKRWSQAQEGKSKDRVVWCWWTINSEKKKDFCLFLNNKQYSLHFGVFNVLCVILYVKNSLRYSVTSN